jgi:hypothetical protein
MPCGYPENTTLTGYRFHKPPAENPVWVFGKGFFNSRLPRYCTHPSTLQAGLLAKVLLNKPGFWRVLHPTENRYNFVLLTATTELGRGD